jgi:hypothetical protein
MNRPSEYLAAGRVAKVGWGFLAEKPERIEEEKVTFPPQVAARGEGYWVVSFAELGPAGAGDQGQMIIGGGGIAEKALQMDLSRRGGKEIGPSDNLVHPGIGVVHHHGQLVGKGSVGTLNHEVSR